MSNGLAIGGNLNFSVSNNVLLSGNAITRQKTNQKIDFFSTGTPATLNTINGGTDGDLIILRTSANDKKINVVNGTGNLNLNSDYLIDSINHTITLLYDGNVWNEIARSHPDPLEFKYRFAGTTGSNGSYYYFKSSGDMSTQMVSPYHADAVVRIPYDCELTKIIIGYSDTITDASRLFIYKFGTSVREVTTAELTQNTTSTTFGASFIHKEITTNVGQTWSAGDTLMMRYFKITAASAVNSIYVELFFKKV